jgi:hypothetical protein
MIGRPQQPSTMAYSSSRPATLRSSLADALDTTLGCGGDFGDRIGG